MNSNICLGTQPHLFLYGFCNSFFFLFNHNSHFAKKRCESAATIELYYATNKNGCTKQIMIPKGSFILEFN